MTAMRCRRCGVAVNAEAVACPACGGDPRTGEPPQRELPAFSRATVASPGTTAAARVALLGIAWSAVVELEGAWLATHMLPETAILFAALAGVTVVAIVALLLAARHPLLGRLGLWIAAAAGVVVIALWTATPDTALGAEVLIAWLPAAALWGAAGVAAAT